MTDANTTQTLSSSLGDYLKSVRLGLKMTLRTVEAVTEQEVSNAYLSQLENGKITKPSPHTLHALAQAYDVSYENLMQRAGYLAQSNSARASSAKHGSAATLSIENLSPEEERELLKYLAYVRSKRTDA